MSKLRTLTILFFAISVIGSSEASKRETLTAFVGSVIRPSLEEALTLFENETGIHIQTTFGGSGALLSQLLLSKRGDIFIPASPDFMDKAMEKGVINKATVKKLGYAIPAILVSKGNPKGIIGLQSLQSRDVRTAIPDPRTVSSGIYAVELLEANSLAQTVKGNIVTYTESYEKALNLVALRVVDVVIGWQQLPPWASEKIDIIPLQGDEIQRVTYVSAAMTNYTKRQEESERLLDFLASDRGRAIFLKHGFLTTEEEVRKVAPKAHIGGRYKLPEGW